MESKEHINLVKIAYKYIEGIVSEEERQLIHCDREGYIMDIRVINNFIPDVYYYNGKEMIIGEAKTEDDFERKHSKEQFDSYIKELSYFSGKRVLVVSVPWQIEMTAKNYFYRKKKLLEYSIEIVILNDLGRCSVI